MKTTTDIINELEELKADNLLAIKKIQHTASAAYFEQLADAVNKKVQSNAEQNKIKWVSYAIAASVVSLFSLSYFFFFQKETLQWNTISAEVYQNYVNENIDEFTEEELLSGIDTFQLLYAFKNTLNDEDIVDFLIAEDITEEELF